LTTLLEPNFQYRLLRSPGNHKYVGKFREFRAADVWQHRLENKNGYHCVLVIVRGNLIITKFFVQNKQDKRIVATPIDGWKTSANLSTAISAFIKCPHAIEPCEIKPPKIGCPNAWKFSSSAKQALLFGQRLWNGEQWGPKRIQFALNNNWKAGTQDFQQEKRLKSDAGKSVSAPRTCVCVSVCVAVHVSVCVGEATTKKKSKKQKGRREKNNSGKCPKTQVAEVKNWVRITSKDNKPKPSSVKPIMQLVQQFQSKGRHGGQSKAKCENWAAF